jgi:hypothetical protein
MADESQSSTGKHSLIEVPDFDGGGMTSYLRLGAVPDPSIAGSAGAPPSTGEDLASKVTSFQDDTRQRDGSPDFVSPGERQAETAKLHTKGGWRDHTDGNRITTTRGDKLEVIEGNFTQLILGRGEGDAIWDMSGGHVYQNDSTFGGGTTIAWVQDYGGTWKITETTIKGQVDTTYVGDTIDRYYGKNKTSLTGSETPCAVSNGVPAEGVPHTYNPVIIDRTWAECMASYTGSAALRVPSIENETWVVETSTSTHATSVTGETIVDGEISSTTRADTITSETTASLVRSTTRADVESTTHGNTRSETFGNAVNITHGFDLTLVYGITNEIMLGGSNEITIGEQAELTAGVVLDVSVSGKLSVNVGGSVEMGMGPKISIKTMETRTAVTETTLSGEKTEISALRSMVGANINLF